MSRKTIIFIFAKFVSLQIYLYNERANGLRYLRWGGDGEAVKLGKCRGVEKGLESRQSPQRRVVSLRRTWQIDVG
jgi:hypothetical protein